MELAKEEGIGVEEGMFCSEDLQDADEAFLTNAGFGVLPVKAIQARPLSSSWERSMSKTIQHLYEGFVAADVG